MTPKRQYFQDFETFCKSCVVANPQPIWTPQETFEHIEATKKYAPNGSEYWNSLDLTIFYNMSEKYNHRLDRMEFRFSEPILDISPFDRLYIPRRYPTQADYARDPKMVLDWIANEHKFRDLHIVPVDNNIVNLSRYACFYKCWITGKNVFKSLHPSLSFAFIYFLNPDMNFNNLMTELKKYERIHQAERLRWMYKRLNARVYELSKLISPKLFYDVKTRINYFMFGYPDTKDIEIKLDYCLPWDKKRDPIHNYFDSDLCAKTIDWLKSILAEFDKVIKVFADPKSHKICKRVTDETGRLLIEKIDTIMHNECEMLYNEHWPDMGLTPISSKELKKQFNATKHKFTQIYSKTTIK